MSGFEHLICPVCQKPLTQTRQSLSCPSGHSFDMASKGYVNLLLSQDKNSKDPGDNKEMVQARRRFLDKGYYEPLSQALCEILTHKVFQKKERCILVDAGCGEGYYTHQIQQSLAESRLSHKIYGVDISKGAIHLATGRNKQIQFLAASLFKLPFSSQCADLIINAFAPSCNREFKRILKKDGFLITVIPGKKHLIELKSVLYDRPYENDEKEPDLISFIKEDQEHIEESIVINNSDDLIDLLAMTPYSYRTPQEGIERLKKLTQLTITLEFIITVYSRHA